jgi:hypothetical protein
MPLSVAISKSAVVPAWIADGRMWLQIGKMASPRTEETNHRGAEDTEKSRRSDRMGIAAPRKWLGLYMEYLF